MKIWNKIVLLSACAYCLTAFMGCSDDSITDKPVIQGSEEKYLSFRLHTDTGTDTRSTGKDDGTTAERKISEIYILLYEQKGPSSLLSKRVKLNASTDGVSEFTGSDVSSSYNAKGFVTNAMKLDQKEYQMLVLANPNDEILKKAVPNSSTLNMMTEAVSSVSPFDFYKTNQEEFFMSNAGGVINITNSDFYESESQSLNRPVTAPIERLLAKVLVYENTTTGITNIALGGKLGSVTWTTSATNKHTYLIRKADKLKDGITDESGFHGDRTVIYAQDPNFSNNKNILTQAGEKEKHFNYIDITETGQFQPWIPYDNQNDPSAYKYQYVLENTFSKEDQNDSDINSTDYITHILLKVIITEPGKLTGVTDYYSYSYEEGGVQKWVVFTQEQAVEWNTGTYPSDMIILKEDEVFKQAHEMTDTPFDFSATGDAPTLYTSTDFGLTYHKGGLNVYRIPIMHFGTESGVKINDYGCFGVVRNNTYKVVITSINGPGINTSNDGYLSATISINDWEGRDWDEDDLDPDNK